MSVHLVLSGGVGHPFADTSAALADVLAPVLEPAGVRTMVADLPDWEDALSDLAHMDGIDLVTVNALRWQMTAPRYDALRADNAYASTSALREGIVSHLTRGGGLLALHTACICFDDWPQWGDILGASWDWDRSFHPLHGNQVALKDSVTGRRSTITDELYHDLAVHADREVLATATLPEGLVAINLPPAGPGLTGEAQAVMWRRVHGGGRVVVDTLGHDRDSLADATHADALRAAVAWALASPGR